jgi:hypothetical protein
MELRPASVHGGQTVVTAFTDCAALRNALVELGLPDSQRQCILSAVQTGNAQRFTTDVSEQVAWFFGWMNHS